MPEEPVCKLASLIYCFQKVGEPVASIGRVDFPNDMGGSAVGQDAVHFPVYPFQAVQRICVFLVAGQFLHPPGVSLDPEHSPHPAQQPILPFKVGVLRIKDAVLNVVGGRPAHGEPGKAAEGEYLSPHQVEDVFPHLMHPASMPFFFRQGIQQGEVLMIPIHEQGGKGLLRQPVQPVLVFGAAVPQPPEIAVIPNSGQWRLYRKKYYPEIFYIALKIQ